MLGLKIDPGCNLKSEEARYIVMRYTGTVSNEASVNCKLYKQEANS